MENLNLENYHKEEFAVSFLKANLFSILLLIPIILLFELPYFLIWGNNFTEHFRTYLTFPQMMLALIVCLVLGIIAHELIHGIVFAKYAKNGFKSIKFGIAKFTPYCHCKEPLLLKHYLIGGLMPTIILGIIPFIISIITGSVELNLFGFIFTLSGAGDLLIFWLLRKENKNSWIEDQPDKCGCYIYKPN
jgi:hypothetical protein